MGQNLESNVIQGLCDIEGIHKSQNNITILCTGNGVVERFNQTFLKMVGTLEEDKKRIQLYPT